MATYMLIAAICLCAVILLLLVARALGRSRERLFKDYAASAGLQFLAKDPGGVLPQIDAPSLLALGRAREAGHIIRPPSGDETGKIFIFDYRFTVGRAEDSTDYRFCVCMLLLSAPLPCRYVRLRTKGLLEQADRGLGIAALGKQVTALKELLMFFGSEVGREPEEVIVPHDRDFMESFVVRSSDRETCLSLLTTPLRKALMEWGGVRPEFVEFVAGRLLCYVKRRSIRAPQDLDALLSYSAGVSNAVRGQRS